MPIDVRAIVPEGTGVSSEPGNRTHRKTGEKNTNQMGTDIVAEEGAAVINQAEGRAVLVSAVNLSKVVSAKRTITIGAKSHERQHLNQKNQPHQSWSVVN